MKRTDIRLRDLRRFAITYKLSVEQAGRLVKRYGFDNERLAAAAMVLARREQRLSKTSRPVKQPSGFEHSSAQGLSPIDAAARATVACRQLRHDGDKPSPTPSSP
jgi:hypothetical protein